MTQAFEGSARRAIEAVMQDPPADAVEVVSIASDTGLTRFANSQIIQNTARQEARVYVRVVVDDRWATATTNQLDERHLRAAIDGAVAAAKVSPPDPDFPGLADPDEVGRPEPLRRFDQAVVGCDPEERASRVREVLKAVGHHNSAGYFETLSSAMSVITTTGVDCSDAYTRCATQCLVDTGEGTGWGEAYSHTLDDVDAVAAARTAAAKAEASANPSDADPGTYEVVLEASAVATMLDYLSWVGFGAKSLIEGDSFFAERKGRRVAIPAVTILDDVTDPRSIGVAFDLEGVPKRTVNVIDGGRANEPVTDLRTARQLGTTSTGHSTGSVEFGPYAANVVMSGGDRSLEDLIGAVSDGILVTRFHYVNVLDRPETLLTGMTRDGTFRIRNGEVGEPVNNFRFAQNALGALASVKGIGNDARAFSESFGSFVAPSLHVGEFNFASRTSH
jgi:predicted Zn-dependent protease